MATLSAARTAAPLIQGLALVNRGKVRDSYELQDGLLLVVATNAVSIFDFVLNALISKKGQVLTAMNHYWLMHLEHYRKIHTHLVAAGSEIDPYLPAHLRQDPRLQARAMVVRRLKMIPIEFVVRGYLTGSGLKSYRETGDVCGHKLPAGLQDGDELPKPLFTPTTKASDGHDLPLDFALVRQQYPKEMDLALRTYACLHEEALERGIILADTKFEIGHERSDIVIADEVGTPDSSRFWDKGDWEAGRTAPVRKAPPAYDKQFVREWGLTAGVSAKLDPNDPEVVRNVQELSVPLHVMDETSRVYQAIFKRLVGMSLEEYQASSLHIETATV